MINPLLSYDSFLNILLNEVPELRPIYQEHIEDNNEFLEHVFMGDVTRFAEHIYEEKQRSECLRRILDLADKAFTANDEKLEELISVSFLENLSREKNSFEGIKNLLSSELKKELSKYN